jgi:CheY-like chemotaxis protein
MNADGKTKPRRRVLIVEDELMIRMMLEDMLDDLGFEVAATAGQVDEAVRLVNDTEFDVAILDMNLNGQAVAPVVEVLEKRGLPYVFATGYDDRGLPDAHRGRPTLQKPFQQEHLERALNSVLTP